MLGCQLASWPCAVSSCDYGSSPPRISLEKHKDNIALLAAVLAEARKPVTLFHIYFYFQSGQTSPAIRLASGVCLLAANKKMASVLQQQVRAKLLKCKLSVGLLREMYLENWMG